MISHGLTIPTFLDKLKCPTSTMFPFLNPKEEIFPAWQQSVYKRITLTTEEVCDGIHSDECQGWSHHARCPHCLENTAAAVVEVLWPDQDQKWDAEGLVSLHFAKCIYFFP